MSCNENFGLSGAVAGLELLRESSAGILPAVASPLALAGGRDARRTAAGTAALARALLTPKGSKAKPNECLAAFLSAGWQFLIAAVCAKSRSES